MSSIDSKNIVKKILENNGSYPDDPQCFSIWEYHNVYGGTTYKLCYSESDDEYFTSEGVFISAKSLFYNRKLTEYGKEWLVRNEDNEQN